MNISPSDVLPVIPPTTFPLSGSLRRTCRGTRSAYPTVASLKAFSPSPMILSASGSGALDTRIIGSIQLLRCSLNGVDIHPPARWRSPQIGVEPCDDLVEPRSASPAGFCAALIKRPGDSH